MANGKNAVWWDGKRSLMGWKTQFDGGKRSLMAENIEGMAEPRNTWRKKSWIRGKISRFYGYGGGPRSERSIPEKKAGGKTRKDREKSGEMQWVWQ